jgi:hypothetical protein
MGSVESKAKVVQNITNNTLNQTDLSAVNSTTMDAAVSTLVKNASVCSSSVDQNNTCSMANADIDGDLDFTGVQDNVAKVNFSCVQANKAAADMGTAMVQALSGNLDQLNGTSAASALNAAASSQSTMGLGVGAANATSNVDNNITNNVTNQTRLRIENTFKNSLKNNFNSETVSECIGRTTQRNTQDLSGVSVRRNARVKCTQSNTLAQVQECKQLNEAISKTMQETAQELGFVVKVVNETKAEGKAEGEAKAKATVSFIPEFEFGGSSMYSSIISLCCCIICCCIISCCGAAAVAGSTGGGKQTNSSSVISDTLDSIFSSSEL